MKRILYLNWAGELGGAEVALLRLLKYLNREKFEPQVFQFQPGRLGKELERIHVACLPWGSSRFRNLFPNPLFHFRLLSEIRKRRVDAIHANGSLAFVLAWVAARLAGIPVIWWLVDCPEGRDPVEKLAGFLGASVVVCNSQATAQAFRKAYPRNKSRTEVVYPSVDSSELPAAEKEKARLRQELGIPPKAPVILSAGRLQKWKGQDILIRSIPSLLKSSKDAVFLFAGGALQGMEDGSEQRLPELARELGVQSACRFLGFRDDLGGLMDLADLVVHTSLRPEPFGLVIAEAMMRGRPVIATAHGGPLEIIAHGQNGWLVAPGNPSLLTEAISTLLGDEMLRAKLGQAGRQNALSRFEAKAAARQMELLYEKILGGVS